MLNWDHFRYMIAVADSGSVSRASVALNVSHATVLRAINRLEDELQLRLFDHVKTGYRLTSDGEDILENARLMHSNVQQIVRKAKSRDTVPSGPLNIITPDPSLFDMMPVFKAFTAQFEQITINTLSGTITKPLDFIEQQVDLLIIVSNTPPEALVGRQLGHVQFGAYVHKDYPLEESFSNATTALNWITWSQTRDSGDELLLYQQQFLLHDGIATQIVMNASTHHDALQAVHAGMGAAFLRKPIVADDLIEVPLKKPFRDWGIWVLTHPDFRTASRVTAFTRFLADRLAKP
jgi:DNA-binding transcriptional LysR family regulator